MTSLTTLAENNNNNKGKQMKRVILMLFFLLPLFLFGQRAKIEFETTMHNFGNISESGGMVSYDFVFKNTGNSPLDVYKRQDLYVLSTRRTRDGLSAL